MIAVRPWQQVRDGWQVVGKRGKLRDDAEAPAPGFGSARENR